jgi:hypothetical protein
MKLLPEGLSVLFAPAALLPALRLGLGLPETPAPGVVPLMPVVVPLDVVPLDVVPLGAPVEVPLCAKAHAFVNTSAAANPSVAIFIVVSLVGLTGDKRPLKYSFPLSRKVDVALSDGKFHESPVRIR